MVELQRQRISCQNLRGGWPAEASMNFMWMGRKKVKVKKEMMIR